VPYAECGGVRLYYEESGSGFPVVFIHEFAGDLWSWEPQLRHFARRYRCIAFNARGYPPSDVPDDPAAYSQDDAVADIVAVLAECGVQRAHIVGLSIEAQGMADAAAAYAATPHRAAMRRKDPRGFDEFTRRLSEHSTDGSVRTMRGVQGGRPAFDELALEACRVPALILAGDEDTPSLEPSLYLRRALPNAALSVLPRTGHAMNLEEPDAFNALVDDFLATVDAGRWETGEVSGDPIL
jgi:pimeloyl-ACP methyl ester carboxylesterase